MLTRYFESNPFEIIVNPLRSAYFGFERYRRFRQLTNDHEPKTSAIAFLRDGWTRRWFVDYSRSHISFVLLRNCDLHPRLSV